MKDCSHNHQNSDNSDDWIDGSWTVDCLCGVNYDDGEEMVNCDECGVWVHTRCSRYVKGEIIFVCDKCRNKKNRNGRKEMVENSVRVLTDRVHVQGIPGGDCVLFDGLSAVFSPELWKSAGFVPKKFGFRYREFPWWDDDGDGGCDRERARNGSRNERSLVDRTKEDLGTCKDGNGKKRARVVDIHLEVKKKDGHDIKTAFTPTSDEKQLELCEDRHLQSLKTGIQMIKYGKLRDNVPRAPRSDSRPAVHNNIKKTKNNFTAVGHSSGAFSSDPCIENAGNHLSARVESSYESNDVASLVEQNDSL